MNEIAVRNGQDLEKMAERFKLLIVNGKNLTAPEALALAQYSIATDLNPFANECYYLPGIGPGPGIAGWRKKADEQLEWEARRAAEPIARFWCDYVDANQQESGDLQKGDIAVKAILHDTLSKTGWERRRLGHFIDLIKAGIVSAEAWKLAQELAGNEPIWTAIGIVRGGENFGSSEKMVRYERACKRAEKAAIRKRFPRVSLPEPLGFDETMVVDATITEVKPEAKPAPEPQQQPTADITIDLAHLAGVVDSKGNAYLMLPSDNLSDKSIGIGKVLAKNGITADQRAEYETKLSAIKQILDWRNSHSAA